VDAEMEIEQGPVCNVDTKQLRRAFGAFATGIAVITVGGDPPHAMTANSFTTVSLDPPLLLICVSKNAIMHDLLPAAGSFAVSVLASGQEAVARHFANNDRPLGKEQFESVSWEPGQITGAPTIVGALARFECELYRTYDGGDHSIFLGSLLSLDRHAKESALIFLHGKYRQVRQQRRNEVKA